MIHPFTQRLIKPGDNMNNKIRTNMKTGSRNVTDNVIIFGIWRSFSTNDTKKKTFPLLFFCIVSLGSGNVTKGMGREG